MFICINLCVVGARSNVAGRKLQLTVEAVLENLILFVPLPQSLCDVLSCLTKQSWSITTFLTFPVYDNSVLSSQQKKTSPVLVYKILYSKSLRGRKGLIKFLSNWTPNIKNTHCTPPPHPKMGLKNSFHNIYTGKKKDKQLYLSNCLKNKIFILCSKLHMGS